jgi:pimeloyl-ACP methyl ester carboxylesterase
VIPDADLRALAAVVPGGVAPGAVDVGGRALRWVETGRGEPTVVLEAGRDDIAVSWAAVMARLGTEGVHVVAYDRAGLGDSDPAPGLPSLERQVSDLAEVIRASARGPCVLVGHSWGGLLAQLLAFAHPELVVGAVLVDPAHEAMLDPLPEPVLRLLRSAEEGRLHGLLQRSGVRRRIVVAGERRAAARLTADRQARALVVRAYARDLAGPDELTGIKRGAHLLHRLRAAPRTFPDVPVVVLSASRGGPRGVRRHWTALQAELAAGAPQGSHRVVAGSGHFIQKERPEAVVGAVHQVIRASTRGVESA